MVRAEQLGPAFAMLFCSVANSRRYARFGFAEVRATSRLTSPAGPSRWARSACGGRCAPGATWPDGPVRVPGTAVLTSANAASARSMSWRECAADICTRMRALPFGTTG